MTPPRVGTIRAETKQESNAVWMVTAHGPTGSQAERFETEDAARHRADELLVAGTPVTLHPPGAGPAEPVIRYTCSFCGKHQRRVKRLIAGPGGVAICGECVALCQDIIGDGPPAPPRQPEPHYL
jgi:hypothetical protein